MKNFFKGASLLNDLQKQFPGLSVSELIKAVHKSKGDPLKAVQLLGGVLSSGGGKKPGSAPDLRKDPEGWFKYYDEDGDGLEQHEVDAAISETFSGAEKHSVKNVVQTMWHKFDPDRSGAISLREFLTPGGLRDSLVAALNGDIPTAVVSEGPTCVNGCGRKPFKTYPTCCTHCKGPHGPHAHSCDSAASTTIGPSTGGEKPAFRPSARPSARRGRQKALLIGINYVGQKAQLRGCVNDVINVRRLLTETYGWDKSSIRTLTDAQATYSNILREMKNLADGAQPGDALVFHFSGHGAQQPDPNGYEEDGMNETIIPVDFKTAGMISDDQLTDIIVAPLPEGVRVTAIMDCCHSGTGLDLPFTHTGRDWKQEVNPLFSACDAQLFSGCEDHATSADVSTKYGSAAGAMTDAFCEELRKNPSPSYTELITAMNNCMKKKGFKQRPQLTSSQPFQFPRQFTLTEAVPNMNTTLGRVATTKFKPNPRPFADGDPLQEMLGPLGALALQGVAFIGGKKAQAGVDMLRAALQHLS